MPGGIPTHEFDTEKAERYRPNPSFEKTAILLEVADPDDITTITASFGDQILRGSFYVVADGTSSYGALRAEFESTHVRLAPNRWRKRGTLLAYRASDECIVETHVQDTHEATVRAEPGDWIAQQEGGEVMVITPHQFASRYEPDDPD